MVARRIRHVALLALTTFFVAVSATALADDVTRTEFADLVAQARNGDVAGLEGVTSVEGAPVDVAPLLAGTSAEREARLETLRRELATTTTPSLDSEQLRAEAEAIVSNPPFSAEATSDSGLLGRIVDFFARLLGNDAAQGVALLIVAVTALLIAIPLLNRRVTRRQSAATAVPEPGPRTDYRTEAESAAAQGEFAAAVRMLFLDGAEHLEQSRAVPDAATTSTATVRRLAGDQRFLDRFDEIAYGGLPADNADVDQARAGWQRLKERWSG